MEPNPTGSPIRGQPEVDEGNDSTSSQRNLEALLHLLEQEESPDTPERAPTDPDPNQGVIPRTPFEPHLWDMVQTEADFCINLTPMDLDEDTKAILNKGLSFAMTDLNPNRQDLQHECLKTQRRILLKNHFGDKEKPFTKGPLRPPSRFTPQCHEPVLKEFLNEIQDVYTYKRSNNNHLVSNIPPRETAALKRLQRNQDITVKKADKGSSIVLMETKGYIREAHRQLSDGRFYKKITTPLYPRNMKAITRILTRMHAKGHIARWERMAMTPVNPKPRRFYGLPKIHKDYKKWHNGFPPLRPIISDCGSESYEVAKYISHHLRPLACRHPAYIQDTWDFMGKLRQYTFPQDCLLISFDVESLYTNIPLLEGIATCREALNQRPPGTIPLTNDLIQLLEIQALNNDFQFAGDTFQQIHGTAMGKSWAPALADLFMAEWEKTLFAHCKEEKTPTPKVWYRFLDDIFCIWTHPHEDLEHFITVANTWHPHIRITAEVSNTEVNFLDLTIHKGERFEQFGALDFKSYKKPNDKMQYLHAHSSHPPHTHTGVIKGLLLRQHRLNTHSGDFLRASRALFQALLNRNYKRRTLIREFRKVHKEIYEHEQEAEKRKRNGNGRIPAVFPYNPLTRAVQKGLSRAYNKYLENLSTRMEAIQRKKLGGPPMVAYKIRNTIREALVRSEVNPAQREGEGDQ